MTTIERVHEHLLSHRSAAPQDEDRVMRWVEGHDAIEEKIGCMAAETLGDVLIKMDILCDRLRQASVCKGDLVIARSAREDLQRLCRIYEN